ncbi:hypothetical protein QVD17_41986 [Tagetes erecta]|uniref:Fatty acid desaturase N-terminal domain-containing protein n=1 Tax=Tagetes erecta TaxID=13708 RepID=A0AAD8N964_TARER|nr:hypothetical protein QVD17_41986 [Tagetes erecta]
MNDDLGIITKWCYTTSKLPRLYPKPRFTIPIYKPITFRCSSVSRFRDRNWGLKVSAPEKIQFVDEDDSEVNNGFNPGAPPPFTLADIRAVIPKHCWVKDPWRSMAYVVRDVVLVFGLAAVVAYFNNIVV